MAQVLPKGSVPKRSTPSAHLPPKGANFSKVGKKRGFLKLSFSTLGDGTPVHCDASRISAGVQFREYAPAGSNHAKHSHVCPTGSQNIAQTFGKSIQNRCQRLLGAHPWPILEKETILNPKTSPSASKSAQKTAQSASNPSQIEPKTLPNPFF